jgi:hypothetical protein
VNGACGEGMNRPIGLGVHATAKAAGEFAENPPKLDVTDALGSVGAVTSVEALGSTGAGESVGSQVPVMPADPTGPATSVGRLMSWWFPFYDTVTAQSPPTLVVSRGHELLSLAPSLALANYDLDFRSDEQLARAIYFRGLKRRHGIANLGNTCFVNALLQVILRIEPLMQMLRVHVTRCRTSGDSCAWCCAFHQASALRGESSSSSSSLALLARRGFFGDAFRAPLRARSGLTSQYTLDRNFKPSNLNMRAAPQCDASDFFHQLVGVLEQGENRALQTADADFERLFGARTVLKEVVFGGLVRTRIRCLGCGYVSDGIEACVSVNLPLSRLDMGCSLSLRELWARSFMEEPGVV